MVTTCATCHPPAPGEARTSDDHVGIRFGDNARGHWTIRLDGVDVTDRCVEAMAGAWVMLADQPKTVCSDDHMRTTLHHGRVEIEMQPW